MGKKREPEGNGSSRDSPKKQKGEQASLSSFFSPPSAKKAKKERQVEDDAIMARKLSKQFNRQDKKLKRDKKTLLAPISLNSDGEVEDDLIIVDDAQQPPIASTSKAVLPPIKPAVDPDLVKQEALAALKPEQDIKPQLRMMSTFDMKGKGVAAPPSRPDVDQKPLDTPVCAFNPLTDVDTSAWPNGRIPFSFLSAAFVSIGATKSRLTIMRIMTNLLRVVIEHDPDSLLSVIYLTTNRLGPAHESDNELGIGSQVLTKAIKEVSGITPQALRALWNKYGDAGDIAFEANKNVRLLIPPAPLACHSLYSTLVKLSKLRGHGVLNQKTAIVKKLLIAAQGEEIRYVTRILVQHIRIGAVRLTLTTALARAFCLSRPANCPVDEYYMTEDERDRYLKIELSKTGKTKTSASKLKDDDGAIKESEIKLLLAETLVRKVWARHPNYGHICDALLTGGLANLDERVPLAVGTPVQPMLGSITRSLEEVYTRLQNRPFVAEAKLDGQRAQIHVSLEAPSDGQGGKGRWYDPPAELKGRKKIWIRTFSRHLEDMTDKYPDLFGTLAAIVARSQEMDEPLTSFMIDAEVVAIDPVTGAFRTFQELSYRSRKDVEMGDIKIRVGIFAFDLMLLNGQSLLSEPFRRRRERLRQYFGPYRPEDPRLAKWELIPSCDDNRLEEVRKFFGKSLEMKAEGIMVKLLDEMEVEEANEEPAADASPSKGKGKGSRRKIVPASYEPDKRADSWLKVKKDYLDDLGDSLDLVPIGAWHGMGRKASWWSPILLGCYDEDTGTWVATCKIISGFTDAFYKELNVRYAEGNENTSYARPSEVEAGRVSPAIWFKPQEVWEVRGADFTLSPVYPAAQGLVSDRGISIRFPRFLRVRDPVDKGIEQATTAEQLAEMYRLQGESGKVDQGGAEEGDEEEQQLEAS